MKINLTKYFLQWIFLQQNITVQIIVGAIPRAGARRSHLWLRSWFSNVYFRPSNRLSEPMGSISIALKEREQGTLCPPCARSAEYFLHPVTVHSVVTHHRKNSEHTRDTFRGKCPMIVPSFFTATAYRSEAFSGSLSHTNDSPTTTSILLYIHGSLEYLSKIFSTAVTFSVRFFPRL